MTMSGLLFPFPAILPDRNHPNRLSAKRKREHTVRTRPLASLGDTPGVRLPHHAGLRGRGSLESPPRLIDVGLSDHDECKRNDCDGKTRRDSLRLDTKWRPATEGLANEAGTKDPLFSKDSEGYARSIKLAGSLPSCPRWYHQSCFPYYTQQYPALIPISRDSNSVFLSQHISTRKHGA